MKHRGEPVDLKAIRSVAMLTVEGEFDDISGLGQTRAAHDLLTAIPTDRRAHYMQPKVGHYGVFNGSRFRAEIAPRISDFIASHSHRRPNGAVGGNGGDLASAVASAADAPAAPKRSRAAKAPAKTTV